MDFYIKCRRCGNMHETMRTRELTPEVHHLECNWCPDCNLNENDYWEEFTCNSKGEAIDGRYYHEELGTQ